MIDRWVVRQERKGRHPGTLLSAWMLLDGLPLFYRTNAEPAPSDAATLIHVHGFGISGTYLVPTARRLATAHPTWVPDLPGFGRSHDPNASGRVRVFSRPALGEA